MTNIWVSSDHHFLHKNILKFTDNNGELIRGKVFKDTEEHDEKIVLWHNELVRPQDRVYFLGDVAINKYGLRYVSRMNGHKRLVRGNHDIFEDKLYYEAGFQKIFGVKVWPKHNLIFSHIPLHPDCLSGRGWKNLHGHLHNNKVRKEQIVETGIGMFPEYVDDDRYQNVSLEQINYRPILVMK